MYEEYWKLKEKPFENNFDLRFLYLSLQHEEAVTRLIYAVRDKRHGVVLSGEYGSGKSMILQYFLQRVKETESKFRIIKISDPMMTMAEFYREFLHQLGSEVVERGSRAQLSSTLRESLVNIHDSGGHTVVAIDESDLIKEETMQEMRLLLDLNHPKTQKALLSLALCGRFGDVNGTAGHLNSPALRQRIPIRCQLDPLDPDQCGEYIIHRLEVAGQSNPLFTDEAIRLVAERSGGAPRVINNVCDLALFLGFSQNVPRVDADIVEAVTDEISGSLR